MSGSERAARADQSALQTARINALDFNSSGEYFVTSSDDESLHLYHVDTAQCVSTVATRSCKLTVDLRAA